MSKTKGFTNLAWMLLVLLLVVLVGFVVWFMNMNKPSVGGGVGYQPPKPADYLKPKGVPEVAAVEAVSAKTALTLALPVATNWKENTKLIAIESGSDVALDGRSMLWDVTFAVEQGKNLEAYHVTIEGGKVKTSEKAETADSLIVPLPENWSDSQEAINRAVRTLKATELKVKHMKFFQNTVGNVWHWSLATDKGVISMLATP